MTPVVARGSWASCLLVTALAFTPIAAGWAFKTIVDPRPYWVLNYDPELAYFYSSLRLARGERPLHVDHPGTPAQIVGAVLIKAGRVDDTLSVDRFRRMAYVATLILDFAAVVLLLRTLLAKLGPLTQIAAVWTYFAFPSALAYMTIWATESLFLFFGAIALVFAWRFFDDPMPWSAFLFGASVGACVALKFTFLPWVVAVVVTLLFGTRGPRTNRYRETLFAILGLCVGFLASTLPIWTQFDRVFSWLWRVLSRSGQYGSGQRGWPGVGAVVANLRSFVASAKGIHLWWLTALVVVWGAVIRSRREGHAIRRPLLATAILASTAMTASYVFTVRDLEMRYLLPAGLMGMVLFTMVWAIGLPRSPVMVEAMASLGAGLLLGKALALDLALHVAVVSEGITIHNAVHAQLGQAATGADPPIVIYSWRVPEPSFALRVEAGDDSFRDLISRRFPHDGDYDPWIREVHLPLGANRWDFLVIRPADWVDFPERGARACRAVDGFLIVAAPHVGARCST